MKLRIWILVGAAVVVLAVANVHLVYVALNSQPACVPHAKTTDEGRFMAARSAC